MISSVPKHGHRARLHIGSRNLRLGLACTLGYFDVHHGRGIGIPGGLHLNRGLDRLTILLGVLDGLAAQLGLRCGLAVLVGLHRAGGAIGGLVLGDGAAVGIGCGLVSAAVLGGRGLHLGAVLLGLGLDLGAVGLGGGLSLSGAAGIVTVRGRTTAEAAEAARGRTAGGLGLNGQRANGVQSFLWRKGNSAEAGVVDRPPRCPLPVVE